MTDELVAELSEAQLRALLRGDREAVRAGITDGAPTSTPISEVGLDETHTLVGVVCSIEDVNQFDRSDGSEGQVRNVRIQDRTGDIRAALWGDHADMQFEVGDYLYLYGAEIESGYQDKLEASVGYESTVRVRAPDKDERHVTVTIADED